MVNGFEHISFHALKASGDFFGLGRGAYPLSNNSLSVKFSASLSVRAGRIGALFWLWFCFFNSSLLGNGISLVDSKLERRSIGIRSAFFSVLQCNITLAIKSDSDSGRI